MVFDWPQLLASYGVAAPFCALALWLLFDTRRELRAERDRAAAVAERALTGLHDSNRLHAESADALRSVAQLMPSPDSVARLTRALEDCERRRPT